MSVANVFTATGPIPPTARETVQYHRDLGISDQKDDVELVVSMTASKDKRNEPTGPSRLDDEDQHGRAPDVGTDGSDRATETNKKAFEAPPIPHQRGRQE